MFEEIALLKNNQRGCQEMSAGPDIKIRSTVAKEITVTENGQKVTKLAPVSLGAVASSSRLYFTLTITNEGDEVATNVVVDNPIPPGTVYAIGSITGEQSVVTCSIDNGVSFHAENEQLAKPGRCTDIRWVVGDILPASSCKLGFQIFVGSMATSGSANLSREFLSLLSRYGGRVRCDIRATNFKPKDRPATVTNSRARFEARNLSRQISEVTPQPKRQEEEAIAQSPEEIRRKLEARKNQTSGGRASFTAKDLEPIVPARDTPAPKDQIATSVDELKAKFAAREKADKSELSISDNEDLSLVAGH